MTFERYLHVTKVNKKNSAFVKELDIEPGDIIGVYMTVQNKRVGDRNHATEVIMRNWRTVYFKRTTLNMLAKFVDSDIIEYKESNTIC